MLTRAQHMEQIEKVVSKLQAAVTEIRASVSDIRSSMDRKQSAMDTKLTAIMAKLSIPDDTAIPDNPGGHNTEDTDSDSSATSTHLLGKMDLPTFDGSDPLGWLARADQYFLVHSTSTDMKLKLAVIAMAGATMSWIQLLLRRNPQLTWSKFSQELLERFGEDLHQCL